MSLHNNPHQSGWIPLLGLHNRTLIDNLYGACRLFDYLSLSLFSLGLSFAHTLTPTFHYSCLRLLHFDYYNSSLKEFWSDWLWTHLSNFFVISTCLILGLWISCVQFRNYFIFKLALKYWKICPLCGHILIACPNNRKYTEKLVWSNGVL